MMPIKVKQGSYAELLKSPNEIERTIVEILIFAENKITNMSNETMDSVGSKAIIGSLTSNIVVNFAWKALENMTDTNVRRKEVQKFLDMVDVTVMDCWEKLELTRKNEGKIN